MTVYSKGWLWRKLPRSEGPAEIGPVHVVDILRFDDHTAAQRVLPIFVGDEVLKLQVPLLVVPLDLRAAHDLLIGAWQFAERALKARHEAISLGNLGTAWEASSAAAGALMLLSRAQNEIHTLLEPPQLR